MTAEERAGQLYDQGCNCGQSVVGAFGEKYGLALEDALRLGNPLGGGMRAGEMCGAISGALLVVGAKYGARAPADKAQKDVCNKKTHEFMERIREQWGYLTCRDLLKHAGKRRCRELVVMAAIELEEWGY